MTDPETVEELTEAMSGRWLVTTQGSTHIWDLDALTYERNPGPHSLSGAFDYDGEPHRITRVDGWPKVGTVFKVWYDDPESPWDREQWRQSSTVRSIERLPGAENQP